MMQLALARFSPPNPGRWGAAILLGLLLLLAGATGDAWAVTYLDAGDIGTGPYYLTTTGGTYVLTEDIVTAGSAFVFAARNITLDLGQHTVTFGDAAAKYRYGVAIPPHYAHTNPIWSHSDITIWAQCDGATVMNGTIVQGNGDADSCAALQAYAQSSIVVHDVVIGISGDNTFAMRIEECDDLRIYANTITDSTEVISNRHQGRAAIDVMNARDGAIEIHGNTIHNCRQWGIRVTRRLPVTVWGRIYDNDIYPNTIVTNGYGIGVHGNMLDVYGNTIRATNGRGIHINLCDRAKVHNNDIDVVNPPTWAEYTRVSAHGIKLEYPTNADVYANTVVSKGLVDALDAISNGSALNVSVTAGSNNWVHDNTFTARHMGGALFNPGDYNQFASAIEITGVAEGSGLRIENNTFVTNDRFFTSSEWHGPSYPEPADVSDLLIQGNTWTRETTSVPTQKHDIFFMNSSVENLRFVDNVGDADFHDYGTGWPWYSCSWSVGYEGAVRTLEAGGDPIPETAVEVRNGLGTVVATPITNAGGTAELVLDEFSVSTVGVGAGHVEQIIEANPYNCKAEFPGHSGSAQVSVTVPDWQVTVYGEPVAPPAANFSGTPTSGTTPLTVRFTDLSTNAPTAWLWSFGDERTSTAQNPTHVYTLAGTYTVALTATNAAGEDTETKTAYITVAAAVAPPTADFVADCTSGFAPLIVSFTDLSTNAPTSWSWTFGDSGTSTARSPSHTYDEAGQYTVSLTARNSGGQDTETKVRYITVTQGPVDPSPVMATTAFSADRVEGVIPLTVTFTDASDGEPIAWLWLFGDGETSRERNPRHTYQAAGVYAVVLTVTRAGGASAPSAPSYVTASPGTLSLTPGGSGLWRANGGILFSLPQPGRTRLEVLDLEGRLLAVPVDGTLPGGEHVASWDPQGIPTGACFLRLTWERRVQTKRILLVK